MNTNKVGLKMILGFFAAFIIFIFSGLFLQNSALATNAPSCSCGSLRAYNPDIGFPDYERCTYVAPCPTPGCSPNINYYCCWDIDNPPACASEVRNPLVSLTGDPVELMSRIIQLLVNLAFIAGVVIFVFMIILGGIQWISAGGDKARVVEARSKLTNAFIGLVVLFSLFFIIKVVERVFGVNILTIDVGSISI